MARFDAITIEDLCQKARDRKIPSEAVRDVADFSI